MNTLLSLSSPLSPRPVAVPRRDAGAARPAVPPLLFGNQLLAALHRLAPRGALEALEAVELPVGRMLLQQGRPVAWLYFPVDALASVLGVLRNGTFTEVAMVGSDGVLGAEAALAGLPAAHDVVVQVPGRACRLPVEVAQALCRHEPGLQAVLLQSSFALQRQIAQLAACNRHHCIEQQLCRWLLSAAARLRRDEVPMTQERLAVALGVRREGVTESARRLKQAGLVGYSRGRILLQDRPGLEARACECHHALQAVSARLESTLTAMEAEPA
ncbi:Crp/Fnr family transcriptional regulator [Azohydromonas aeria]|uniref:Crp/Fnr family transcriptional regulator n=1 Tax=Azohydromonas aeria TaxID=2590212 RepID=UPI0012FCB143|nr:Crp/Fnr family transcriptional regulator [Azohydromonas aeria]